MPNLTRKLPKYRHHRASGQALVTLDGQDFYLGRHGTKASRIEYDRLVCEWMANGRRLPQAARGVTITEMLATYWKYADGYYRKDREPTSTLKNLKHVLRIIRETWGPTDAAKFGPVQFKAFRQKLLDADCSRRTINDYGRLVKAVFKWAAGEGLVPLETYSLLAILPGLKKDRSPARETKPVPPVAETTIEATLPHLPAVVADMVRLQRLTGARPAEVCILRPCDLDCTGDVWLYRPSSHKTQHHGRERIIFIGPKGQEVLLRYLARDPEAYCFRPVDSEEKRLAEKHAKRKTPLSCGNRPGSNRKAKPKRSAGERYTTGSYRRAVHRVCQYHGIGQWSPGQLRHSAATEIRRQFGLEATQVVLGHSRADVTQIYAERDMAKGADVARRIG